MDRLRRIAITATVLFGLSFCYPMYSWAVGGATANLVTGWNLLGNSASGSLDVATAFGNAAQVTTVWKWLPAKSKWAFYTPVQTDGGAAYAAGKGYDFLTSIGGGEGFWVNAKSAFTAPLPAGISVSSASFRQTLGAGWNLISSGDNKTPSLFNQALSTAPPPFGTIPVNLITLWSWDASLANWYFYAPSLEAKGGTALSDYVSGKSYLSFGTKSLSPVTGFWVNRSSPPASISLSSLSVMSALPMSVLTINGTGFDPTATTLVHFSDANQYSVDVRPIRVSGTAIAVAVPPYFELTSAVFAPGTVSLKVVQTSGAGTRSSAALGGFQIQDLPSAVGAAGAVTLGFLQALQTQATTLQSAIVGSALDSTVLRAGLASQANSLGPLIAEIQKVVQDGSQRVALGTVQGVAVSLGAGELRQTDRLLLGMVRALGADMTGFAGANATAIAKRPGAGRAAPVQLAYNGALGELALEMLKGVMDGTRAGDTSEAVRGGLMQLAQSSPLGGCMQAEANAYSQCVAQGGDSGTCNIQAMASAPRQSTLCSTPGAVNMAMAVVGAGLVVGIGVTAMLLGVSVGAVAGTAGVLGLAGYLAYATVATGLAQIGIGGALGQSTAGARELVEGGVKQLNDFVRDTTISLGVGTVAGETAGYINDAITAAKNLGDALEQTVIPAPATTTTSTTTTTSSTATSTTTSIIAPTSSTTTTPTTTTTTTLATAYCACHFDVYTNGGTWFCHNTNTWDFSGYYLMSDGKCSCDPDLYQVCQ